MCSSRCCVLLVLGTLGSSLLAFGNLILVSFLDVSTRVLLSCCRFAFQVCGEGHEEKGAEDGGRGRGAAAADAGVRAQLAHNVRSGAAATLLPVREPAHRHARCWPAVGPIPAMMHDLIVVMIGGWMAARNGDGRDDEISKTLG